MTCKPYVFLSPYIKWNSHPLPHDLAALLPKNTTIIANSH